MESSFVISTTRPEDFPPDDRPQVAMVGRSNVGKSSMVNSLTHRKNLARVSGEPGRTQTINFYNIDDRFYLVDLPGYGYAKTSQQNRVIFAEMLGEYLTNTLQLKLVLLIVDARLGPTEFDQEMIAYLRSLDLPFVMIVNKIDKLTRAQAIDQMRKLGSQYPDIQLIAHSSVEAGRREAVWQAIEAAICDTQVD